MVILFKFQRSKSPIHFVLQIRAGITLIFITLILGNLPCQAQLYLTLKSAEKKTDSILDRFNTDNALRFEDFSNLTQYTQTINDSLQSLGYLSAYLSKIDKKNDTLYIGLFNIGKKTDEIYIHYKHDFISRYAEKLNLPVQDSLLILQPSEIKNALEEFTILESAQGYPLTSFQIININQQNEKLHAYLKVDRKRKRYINRIKITGYEKFPRSFIKHYVNLKENQTFNEEIIDRKYNQLKNLEFLDSDREPEVLFEQDTTTIYFYFKKQAANRFDGLLGFGNNQNQNKLRLDGYLDLYLLNNLNHGELLELNYKSDGNDQQMFRLAATLPFLFSTPLGAEAELNLFRRDSTFSTSQQRFDLSYQLSVSSKVKLGAQLESSTSLNNSLSNNPIEQIEDYDKRFFGAGYEYVSRSQESLFPIKSRFDILAHIGEREALSTESQFSIEERFFHNFNINQKQQLYLENQTNFLGSETYFTNELFRFGGINSIRGFRENSIYANLVSVFRTEYRYIPTTNFYIHSISDAAYYENDILNEQEFIYSLGFGAGIVTAAGLLNINLANGLRASENFQFSNSILHIRLTTTF